MGSLQQANTVADFRFKCTAWHLAARTPEFRCLRTKSKFDSGLVEKETK